MLFHLSPKRAGLYGLIDKPGLPGLEMVLRDFPETGFVGHAPSFWNEIDGKLRPRDRNAYPAGPIEQDGSLWRLMDAFPNLYGDISAGSGHNALTRDPEAGIRFIRRFHKKLFFGTDMFFVKDEPPPHLTLMQDLLASKRITKTMYENIMHRNFTRVFGA